MGWGWDGGGDGGGVGWGSHRCSSRFFFSHALDPSAQRGQAPAEAAGELLSAVARHRDGHVAHAGLVRRREH